MGKLIYAIMTSLDGFMEAEDASLDWGIIDEELHSFVNEQERQIDTFLYGRRMYENMSAYWPDADRNPANPDYINEYARIWRAKPKLVFSRTLEKVEHNARLARDNIVEEVRRLKAQPGKAFTVSGAELAGQMIELGLVDIFRLYIHPVLLGTGAPTFRAPDFRANLRLRESHIFRSGVVYLGYEKGE